MTPDVPHLDPLRSSAADVEAFRRKLEERGLAVTIEAGARFVLDPARKHYPTLLTNADFARRQWFYAWAIDLAADLGSPIVSIWSGAVEPDTPPGDAAFSTLATRLVPTLEHAAAKGVALCFEPEPGMLVQTIDDYLRLCGHLSKRTELPLALTIDTGHLAAGEAPPWDTRVIAAGPVLRNVQLDDAATGVHEHLMFGDGDVDFRAIARALTSIGYDGPCSVELSRHSHDAARVAKAAIRFLRDAGF